MGKYLILKAYEFLTAFLPFIIAFAAFAKTDKECGRANPVIHFLLACAFAVYIAAAFYFTGSGTLYDLIRYGKELHLGQYNFIPFSNDIDVVAYLENVLLFIPLGGLLPLIWPKTGKFRYALLSGFSFSLLIEVSQIFNHRATDVDDLIMNTLGAALGYFLYKAFARITKWEHKRTDYTKYEPLIYIAAMFTGRFLMFNEIGMAKMLYGF